MIKNILIGIILIWCAGLSVLVAQLIEIESIRGGTQAQVIETLSTIQSNQSKLIVVMGNLVGEMLR